MRYLNLETIRLGLTNLRLHKLRSLLTSLGIIFGVAAVICMLSISEGASADELRMIELLGTRNIIVNSVRPAQSTQVSQGNTNLLEYGITRSDVELIRQTLKHVKHVVPLKTISYMARRGDRQVPTNVFGTNTDFFQVVNINVSRGRPIAGLDRQDRSLVCVIGDDVRKELFPFSDPLGETILVQRMPSAVAMTVVGVLSPVQTAGAPARGVEERNLNKEIIIPLSTATAEFSDVIMRRQAGSREITKVHYSGLYVTAEDIEYVLPVSEMIKRVFAHGHEKLDYEIRVPLERLNLARQKKRNNQYVLGFIAGISLLVGGIGIMNIMLATVTERTREIGIRRALGARRAHIIVQFLVETVLLSTTGGLAGVALGIGGAHVVNQIAQWETIVSLWSVVTSFALSVLVGIFFGLYPAWRAALLDPIEALRYE